MFDDALKRTQDDGDQLVGPGTDLVLSLTAVLIVLFAIFTIAAQRLGLTSLEEIEAAQRAVLSDLAEEFALGQTSHSAWLKRGNGGLALTVPARRIHPEAPALRVTVSTEFARQRFTFGSGILFEKDRAELNPGGKAVIAALSRALQTHLATIEEIKIEGHADTDRPSQRWEGDNLRLAAARAISVFEEMNYNGILPESVLMSATSFGHFKPVYRTDGRVPFSAVILKRENASLQLKDQNRRIEIVLIYKTVQ